MAKHVSSAARPSGAGGVSEILSFWQSRSDRPLCDDAAQQISRNLTSLLQRNNRLGGAPISMAARTGREKRPLAPSYKCRLNESRLRRSLNATSHLAR